MKKTKIIALLLAVSMTIASVSCSSKGNTIDTENEEVTTTESNLIDVDYDELEYSEKVSEITTTVVSEVSATVETTTSETPTNNDGGGGGGGGGNAPVVTEKEHIVSDKLYDYLGDLNYKNLDEYPLIDGTINISLVTVVQKTKDGRFMQLPTMYRNMNAKSAMDAFYFQVGDGEPVYSSYSNGNVFFGTKEQIGEPIAPNANPITFVGIPIRLNCLDYQMDNPPCYMYIETTLKEDTSLYLDEIDNCFIKAVYCNSYDADADCRVYFHNNLHVGLDKNAVENIFMKDLNHFEKDGLLIYRTPNNTLCIKFDSNDIVTDILLVENNIDYNIEW